MNFLKKSTAGLMAAALLAATGCSGDTSWVYRVGGIQPPAGVYLIYMINSASTAGNKLDEADHDEEGHVHEDITYKELLKKTLEEQPVAQWIESDAQRQLRQYLAVEKMSADRGLSLTDAELASARSAAANSWQSYGEFYEKNGVAQSSMQLHMENTLKSESLFGALYGKGGEREVPEETIRQTLSSDYARIEYMLFAKAYGEITNDDGTTESVEDQNEKIKSTAQAYLSRLEAGESIEELVFEQETAEMKESGSDAKVTKPEPGEREMIIHESMKGSYYSDELIEGSMAIAAGNTALLEDSNLYYVVRRLDILDDADALEQARDQILKSLKQEEFNSELEAMADSLDPEVNQAALDTYKASTLKID